MNTTKKVNGVSEQNKSLCGDRQNNNIDLSRPFDDATILSNPMLKIEVMLDRKIRNLEKRKQKLLQYGDQQKKGEQLTRDQKQAYSRLGDVSQQLEFFNEMRKAVGEFAEHYQQALKRTNESDRIKRVESERNKLAALMRYQELSNVLGNPSVRNAFAQGSHGALKLSEKELEIVDALFTLLNPSLEGICALESWLMKTDECANAAAHILDASKETVMMQHSGDELKSLLDKISNIELAHLSKLLDENKQKEEEGGTVEASTQTLTDSAAPVTSDSGVDECSIVAVIASPKESANLQTQTVPPATERREDITSEMKDTAKEVKAVVKMMNPSKNQEESGNGNAMRTEREQSNKYNDEHSFVRFDNGDAYRRRDRRHTWDESRFGSMHRYNNMVYRTYGVNRHSSCSSYHANEYLENGMYKEDSYYGYCPSARPYPNAVPMVNEPYYCVAYPTDFVNAQHLNDCYTTQNTISNQEDQVFTPGSDCRRFAYGFGDSQPPFTQMADRLEMTNTNATCSSEHATY